MNRPGGVNITKDGARLLESLSPASISIFHRVVRFRPTGLPASTASRLPFRVNLLSAAPTNAAVATTTPGTVGLILRWVSQSWLVRGLDPAEPNAYSRMQEAQGAMGQFTMSLAVGNRNVGQVDESIYSYALSTDTGLAGTESMPGWTALNRNLIDFGSGGVSSAIYVPPETKLEALFYQNPFRPWLHKPDVIEVELNGYVCPKSMFDQLTQQ